MCMVLFPLCPRCSERCAKATSFLCSMPVSGAPSLRLLVPNAHASGYHLFAGNDCTRNLATMNLDRKALGDPDFAPTTDSHKKVLQDWVDKLSGKYPVVGELVGPGTFTGDEDGVKSSAAAHAAKEGSDAACPITGQTAKDGASCPMSTYVRQ